MRISLEAKIDNAKKVIFFMDNDIIVKNSDIEVIKVGDTKKLLGIEYNYKNESIEVWKAYIKLIDYTERKKIASYSYIVLGDIEEEEAKALVKTIKEDIAKKEEEEEEEA